MIASTKRTTYSRKPAVPRYTVEPAALQTSNAKGSRRRVNGVEVGPRDRHFVVVDGVRNMVVYGPVNSEGLAGERAAMMNRGGR